MGHKIYYMIFAIYDFIFLRIISFIHENIYSRFFFFTFFVQFHGQKMNIRDLHFVYGCIYMLYTWISSIL